MRFRKIDWFNLEEVTQDKLNDMCSNDDLMYQQLPLAYHTAGRRAGVTERGKRINGRRVRIEAGVVKTGGYRNELRKTIHFDENFAKGCKPTVIATLATPNRWRTTINVAGRGRRREPDRHGFSVVLGVQAGLRNNQREHFKWQYVHYIAIGWDVASTLKEGGVIDNEDKWWNHVRLPGILQQLIDFMERSGVV